MQGTHAPPHKQKYDFDYGDSQYYGGNRQPNNVSYNNNVSIEYIDERDKENKVANRCARTTLLVFVGIFSVAALALGIASVLAEPWWTYEESSGMERLRYIYFFPINYCFNFTFTDLLRMSCEFYHCLGTKKEFAFTGKIDPSSTK